MYVRVKLVFFSVVILFCRLNIAAFVISFCGQGNDAVMHLSLYHRKFRSDGIFHIGPIEDPRPLDLNFARACSLRSALCSESVKLPCA